MGLDNGIKLRTYNEILRGRSCNVEICYFRKCWGIREKILDILKANHTEYNTSEFGGGTYNLDSKDIKDIKKIIKRFLDEDYFNNYADSKVFTYEEYKPILKKAYNNLRWLRWYLWLCGSNVKRLWFYDSY